LSGARLADVAVFQPQRIALEKLRLGCSYVLDNAELELTRDVALDAMVVSLRSHVLADKLVGDTYTTHYEVPANVWQMFKERHMPAWFVRRFPVRYDRKDVAVRFERYATYPDARISNDRTLGKPICFERVTPLAWGAT
jgi:hypothetical protein